MPAPSPRPLADPHGTFWSPSKVRWYLKALVESDYGTKVLQALEPVLPGTESILDVGAGCGALALPLAQRVGWVTALEPAPAMTAALRERTAQKGLRNVRIIEGAWGQVPVSPHDGVLCAHVGGLLDKDSPFLGEALAYARRWVALVRDAGLDRDKFFFRELYPLIWGEPYGPTCDYLETVVALHGRGILANVTLIDYRSDQPFDNFHEAVSFYEEYLEVEKEWQREALREFLSQRLLRRGETLVAPYSKGAAVIWWKTEGQRD